MNQYIITDEQLQQLLTRTQKNPLGEGHGSKYLSLAGWEISTIVDKVYHHPYNPQAEREKVLDEMLAALQNEGMAAWDERGYIKFIQSFRREGKDGE